MTASLFSSRKEAKGFADRLRERLLRSSCDVPFQTMLEGVAAASGFRDWNTMSGMLGKEDHLSGADVPHAVEARAPAPASFRRSGIELLYAPPGRGGSIYLADGTLRFFRSVRATGRRPRIAIVESGRSQAGVVAAIADEMGEGADAVFSLRMENRLEHALNPFDTEPGQRHPSASHRRFLIRLVRAMVPARGICSDEGLHLLDETIEQAIEIAYATASDESPTGSPHAYVSGAIPSLDRTLVRLGIPIDGTHTWWSLHDVLKAVTEQDARASMQAQRMATPTLKDLIPALETLVSSRRHELAQRRNEMVDLLVESISNTLSRLRILQGPTIAHAGDAVCRHVDILGLVDERVSGPRYTAVCQMLACRFATADWLEAKYLGAGDSAPTRVVVTESHLAVGDDAFSAMLDLLDQAHRRRYDMTVSAQSRMVLKSLVDLRPAAVTVMGPPDVTDMRGVLNCLQVPREMLEDAGSALRAMPRPDIVRGTISYATVAQDEAPGMPAIHHVHVDPRIMASMCGMDRLPAGHRPDGSEMAPGTTEDMPG